MKMYSILIQQKINEYIYVFKKCISYWHSLLHSINTVKPYRQFSTNKISALFTFVFLITFEFSSYAQLSVRNDYFVFVNDEIIFVDNALTLGETDSKFYLRREGQLIQGNEISSNTGIGELSVYQTGNASNFTYNYWCSPVGNNSSFIGNEPSRVSLIDEATNIMTLEDPIGLISSTDALFTSNFDGFSSPSLTISNRWLYTFSTSDSYADWNYVGESSPITTGLGFTMKGVTGTNNQLYDFRGKANNGTISNLITPDEFTLIGNPYPSALDALLFIHDPQNTHLNSGSSLPTTTGVLYFWEQSDVGSHTLADYIGGYATYTISATGMESFVNAIFSAYDTDGNPISLPINPQNTGVNLAKRYIPIGQGFMVEGATGAPAGSMVYVKNSHRVYQKISSGNSLFFRNAPSQTQGKTINDILYNNNGLSIVPEDHRRFRLNITFNDQYTRQLIHNFHDTATPGFDYGMEAKSANENIPTDAFWILDGAPYNIQAHAFTTDLAIPLAIKSDNQQQLKFSIYDIQNFDNTESIFLHDLATDIYVDLTQQDYNINIDEGVFDSRFEIVFETSNTLSTETSLKDQFDIFVSREESTFVVLNPNLKDLKSFQVFDLNGKLVLNHTILNTQDKYIYTSKTLSEGVYVTNIQLKDNRSFTKKVIISQK